MKRYLAFLLALVMLFSTFGSMTVSAADDGAEASSDTLVVYTKSGATRTFHVGDTFTYTYWLNLKPQYVLDQISTHVLYDSDCLTLNASVFPNFNDQTALTQDNPGDFRFHKSAFTKANGRVFASTIAQLVGCTFTVTRGGTAYIRCLMEELQVENLSGTEYDFVDDFLPRIGTVMFTTYDYLQDEKPTLASKALDEHADVSWFYVKDGTTDTPVPAGLDFTITGMDESGAYVERKATSDEYGFIGFGTVPYGDYYVQCESAADENMVYLVQESAQHIPQVANGKLALNNSLTVNPIPADELRKLDVTFRWLNEEISQGETYSGDRPKSLYMELNANGVIYAQRYVNVDSGASGSVTFQNLPKLDAAGEEIVYTLSVTTLDQYTTEMAATETGYHLDFTYRNNHTWETTRVEPTCTENGSINSVCTDCGAVHYVELTALGHDYAVSGRDATCTQTGYHRYMCMRCDHWYEEHVDALGHDWGAWENLSEPDPVTGDVLRMHTCTRCGEIETQVLAGPNHKHTFEEVKVEPTCTEQGYTKVVCACGYEIVDANSNTPALDHSWIGATTNIIEPTCVENGLKEYTCARCGETYTETLKAHGHSYAVTDSKDPTCGEAGYQIQECGYCHDRRTVRQPALGHKWGEWIIETAATATTEGTRYRVCRRCGTKQTDTIPKLDHTCEYSIPKVTEPTCTEPGYTAYLCTCGESIVDEDSYVEALGHDFIETDRVLATDRTQGLVTYQCTHCGQYHYETLQKLPTSWKNPFWDVSEGDWYYNQVCYVAQNDLMVGTSTTRFSPNQSMSRAMLVTVLYRMAGAPEVDGMFSPFTDVHSTAYYYKAVAWAYTCRIVAGVTDTTFCPDQNITREQMIAIFYRYAIFKDYDTSVSAPLSRFPDENAVSGYAVSALSWGVGTGLISGVGTSGASELQPQGTATRAQAATIITLFDEWRITNVTRGG